MSDNQEYNRLVRQKNSTQSQYNACNSRIENCDYLLRRLRSARDDIKELKKSFKNDVWKPDQKEKREKRNWCGEKKDSCDSKMQAVIDADENYQKKSLDHVLDSLNNEITRIENQRLSEKGLLGQLGAALNTLRNKIANFFN